MKQLDINKILALRQKKKDAKMVMDYFKQILSQKLPHRGYSVERVISDARNAV